jgi:hypothetical protein
MKKLLLLTIAIIFSSCSTDEITLTEDTSGNDHRIINALPSCILSLSGSVIIDVTAGIQNPVAVFTANVTSEYLVPYYKARLEIEMLSDCEDVQSGNGNVTSYSTATGVRNPSVNTMKVVVDGDLLPATPCYRWRMVVDGSGTPTGKPTCTTYSEWYEAPLF